MKTYQQFSEDAASDFRSGQLAYQSSASARLAARRNDAAERSRTSASDFSARSKEKVQAQKERHAQIRKDYEKRMKK